MLSFLIMKNIEDIKLLQFTVNGNVQYRLKIWNQPVIFIDYRCIFEQPVVKSQNQICSIHFISP